MKGRIHSRESFGTVDGPGIRYVLFMQGCPMRCLYCHNPDTWDTEAGTLVDHSDIIKEFNKNRAFYENGGLTVTGGEPLLQMEFLTELFRDAKKDRIHTCIDTSGITFDGENGEYLCKLDELLFYTDLVMLDIKHIDSEKHKALTGRGNERVLSFAKHLEKKNVPVWIRHIIVEGYTDCEDDLVALGRFIGGLKNLKALDVLPYHTMGVPKYKELGIKYPLEGMNALPLPAAAAAKAYILRGIKETRQ